MPFWIPNIPLATIPKPSKTIPGIERYEGQTVEDFCEFHYGTVGDEQNHCAHFVSHVLGIEVGTTCESLLSWAATKKNIKAGLKGRKGYTTRVNDLYNSLDDTGLWG